MTYLRIIRIHISTLIPHTTRQCTPPIRTPTLRILTCALRHGQRKDLHARLLGRNHDQGRGVRGHHAREDGGVGNENVVGAVDFGVGVDNGGAACETAIETHLCRAHPVVGAAGADVAEGERDLGAC